MKEKRYFCDWFDEVKTWKLLLIIFSTVLIISIISIPITNKWVKEFFEDSKENEYKSYDYLYEIAENAINEGIGIDITTIPENVKYNIYSDKENIIFKFYCDSDEDGINEDMEIILSKDLKIISSYSKIIEQQELKNNPARIELAIKTSQITLPLLIGLIGGLIIIFIFLIICLISTIKKKLQSEKKLS